VKKLKTMNEISAAEALEIFHAADWHSGFPKYIAARDFLECFKMWRDGASLANPEREELAEDSKTLTGDPAP